MDGWAEEIPDAAGKLVTRRLVREISELAGATLGRPAAVSTPFAKRKGETVSISKTASRSVQDTLFEANACLQLSVGVSKMLVRLSR